MRQLLSVSAPIWVNQAAYHARVLHGVLAAAVTPLSQDGGGLDLDAISPLVGFYAESGLDGLLCLGTTGEGVLLDVDERRQVAESFVEAAASRLQIAVHAGAQTTAATVKLAAHAAAAGADAVAVIGPPYFQLDPAAIRKHFVAAAEACAPLPFYIYEFAARSGYAVPPALVEELRSAAPNLAGLKVSDTPWNRFAPYLIDGLDVFIGPESLIGQGLEAGAAGVVSGLGAGFPELVVGFAGSRDPKLGEQLTQLREAFDKLPFQAALKWALRMRGLPISAGVRSPLRGLTPDEEHMVEGLVSAWLASSSAAPAR